MNTPRRAAAAALAVLVLAGTLGACTSNGDSDPGPTTSAPSTPTTSSSPTKSPEDQAGDAAIATWKDYMAAQTKVFIDSSTPLTALTSYAVDPALSQAQQSFQQNRDKGYVGSGAFRIDSAEASELSTVTDPSSSPPTYPLIHVKGCYDSVTVALTDSAGTSVQVPNRQTYFNYDVTLTNAKYPSEDQWRVSVLTQTAVALCASSS